MWLWQSARKPLTPRLVHVLTNNVMVVCFSQYVGEACEPQSEIDM
jgi:hypothetical protein